MKVIKSSFEEINEVSLYKKIELAGRTCYKSENYITENSAIDFTRRIMSYNHGSVLEHACLVFEIKDALLYESIKALNLKFFKISNVNKMLVSFNFRAFYNVYLHKEKYPCLKPLFRFMALKYSEVLTFDEDVDNSMLVLLTNDEILKLSEEEKNLHLNISIRFICDRGVSHELVRHRLASFAQESTRYCNYSKDKFSHELTFIQTENLNDKQKEIWHKAMEEAEKNYFLMLDNGAKPEQARSVLPNSLKTEIVTTCNLEEWKIIFDLRCAPSAHPDIRILMIKVREYFKERGYLC